MSNRNLNQSREHEELVRGMIREYTRQNYPTIRADLAGFEQPPELDGFIPDVLAEGRAPFVILEAETCESIDADHTEDQWRIFSNVARQQNGAFHVIVPHACVDNANNKLRELGITNATVGLHQLRTE